MNITGSVSSSVQCHETLSNGTLDAGATDLRVVASQSFTNGTTAGKCDLKFSETRTLAPSGTFTYVLSALTDGLNRAVAFTRIKDYQHINANTVDGDDLVCGNAGSHPWAGLTGSGTATFTVKSMGFKHEAAFNTTGFPVVSGSSDQFLVSNPTAHSITYTITFLGTS